ncbi:hypothetical protein ABT144_05760 [Streptomyces sp. NPDC002039]|uniref:hypothetical protein n=1 Tax=Streptomyces sp. NPDC002039 TaxID=3154660 RepID=UPI0033267C0D
MSSTHNIAMGKLRAPIGTYILMVVVGVALAAAFGAAAALFREGNEMLTFGVFAATMLGPCLSLSWFVLVARHTVSPDRHAEENIEHLWIKNATSGACTDTCAACGIALTAVATTGLDISGTAALGGVLVLMLVDTTVRYLVEKRRSR